MAHRVFIDGQEGTTGLQLRDRLAGRPDIALIEIDPALRKDAAARRDCMAAAEVVFLCLPDAAAVEAVALMEGLSARVIDASTAHRTSLGWAYGFPELGAEHRTAVAEGKWIANPGCHATGFLSIVYPLLQRGLLSPEALLSCHSITGYSGGGKKMIADYENPGRSGALDSPRQYGLGLQHKHLPEMTQVGGLSHAPVFGPIVADFPYGMAVSLPLHSAQLGKRCSVAELVEFYREYYAGSAFISAEAADVSGMIAANELAGTNRMKIYVCGGAEHLTIVSVFDNLGKGASGAAVQNMNIALGLPDDAYLR